MRFSGKPHPIYLSYEGSFADSHLLDFYDFVRAIQGFERSLALTTHLVLNREVITQVTALKGAQILCSPPQAGSFKFPGWIVAASAATFALGSLKNDNPLGHIIYSTYEYVVFEATGQKVDYEESLRETYEKAKKQGSTGLIMPRKSQLDSLIEKVEPSISDMHRPVMGSKTADSVRIYDSRTLKSKSGSPIVLDASTHEGLRYRKRGSALEKHAGCVSSFNMNTFNGRIVTSPETRPIPFYITPAGRNPKYIKRIVNSFSNNISQPYSEESFVKITAFVDRTRTGRIAKFNIVRVTETEDFFDLIEDE